MLAQLPTLSRLGFTPLPRRGLSSLVLALGAGAGFGVYMALADATLFSSVVPPLQRELVAGYGALPRIALAARGTFLDEIALRLVTMSGLAWLALSATRCADRSAHWLAIVVTAFAIYPLWRRVIILASIGQR